MLPLILKFLVSRNARRWIYHLLLCVFLFISSILLLCLTLACLHPTHALSDVYLIEAKSVNLTVTRTGYFHMCMKPQQNATFGCASLGSFKHSGGLAYTFAKHVSRPYFLCLSLAVTLVAFFYAIVRTFVQKIGEYFLPWLIITFIFSMVTAVWQQVAVQAATHLIEDNVKGGNRAGGMVWTAFAFITLALILDLVVLESTTDDEYEDIHSKAGEHSVMSTIYKVGDGMPSI